MRTEYTAPERTQRRVIGPAEYPDLQRAAERAERHGLMARRTHGLAAGHWLVESQSDPTLIHEVTLDTSGSILTASCDCIGWHAFRVCQHIGAAAKTARLGPWRQLDIICSRDRSGTARVNIPQTIVYHSPAGFEFGYGGSGPADLALNILARFTDHDTAFELHQRFKWAFVARLPEAGGRIAASDVEVWIAEQLAATNMPMLAVPA